jgi:hypothetical protein
MVDGILCGNQSFALRLFDELIRLGIEGNGKYLSTRSNIWNFLKNIVIADTSGNKWQDFFEDHSEDEDNPTQFSALETARYLLEKRDTLDPQWSSLVSSIISTVKRHWTVHSGDYTAIGEQKQEYGWISLDPLRYEVSYKGKVQTLTSKEFKLLEYFLANRGRVLSRDVLLNEVWGYDYFGTTRTVDVHVAHLRQKLPVLSDSLISLKGLGYKLQEEPPKR